MLGQSCSASQPSCLTYYVLPPSSAICRLGVPIDQQISSTYYSSIRSPFFLGHHNAVTRISVLPYSFLNIQENEHPSNESNTDEQSLVLNKSVLTASRDGTLRIWDTNHQNVPINQTVLIGHSNWVNDVSVITNDSVHLAISGSNDKTVRLWELDDKTKDVHKLNETIKYPVTTLVKHADYVCTVATAASKFPRIVVSGGVDGRIIITNIESYLSSTQLSLKRAGSQSIQTDSLNLKKCNDRIGIISRPRAIQCLKLSSNELLLSSASGHELLIWDLRHHHLITSIPQAHHDIVRQFSLTDDGQQGISVGSDGYIRLWDFRGTGSQLYKEIDLCTPIWSLWSEPIHHSYFFTGDRDGIVLGFKRKLIEDKNDPFESCFWCSDITNHAKYQNLPDGLQWTGKAILSLECDLSTQTLWASGGDSSAVCWDFSQSFISSVKQTQMEDDQSINVSSLQHHRRHKRHCYLSEPSVVIFGFPKLKKYCLLSDQRTLITQSMCGIIQSWDIVNGLIKEPWIQTNFEKAIQDMTPFLSVSSWCSIDIRLGMICVILIPKTAFNGETLKCKKMNQSETLNYGSTVLDRLFLKACQQNKTQFSDLTTFMMTKQSEPNDLFCETNVTVWSLQPCQQPIDYDALSSPLNSQQYLSDQIPTCVLSSFPAWISNWIDKRMCEPDNHINYIPVHFLNVTKDYSGHSPSVYLSCKRWTLLSTVITYLLDAIATPPSSDLLRRPERQTHHTRQLSSRSHSLDKKEAMIPSTYNLTNCICKCQDQLLDLSCDIGTIRDLIWRNYQLKGKNKPFEITYEIPYHKIIKTQSTRRFLFKKLLQR